MDDVEPHRVRLDQILLDARATAPGAPAGGSDIADITALLASLDAVLADASPVARSALLADLAGSQPALLMWNAQTWVGPGDWAVLACVPEPSQRIAVAGAARPWTREAIEHIGEAGTEHSWHPLDTAALQRVMADAAPELTRPDGSVREPTDDDPAGDRRRWWIVAERPWAWTVWRRDDGAFAIEELERGWSMLGRSRFVDEAEAMSWAAQVLRVASDDGPEQERPRR